MVSSRSLPAGSGRHDRRRIDPDVAKDHPRRVPPRIAGDRAPRMRRAPGLPEPRDRHPVRGPARHRALVAREGD